MLFLLLNLYILTSLYLLIKTTGIKSIYETILSIFTLFSAQIIITQTFLGALAYLNYLNLTILNLIISSLYLYFGISKRQKLNILIIDDLRTIIGWFKTVYTPYNIILSLLLIVLSIWIIMASYLLPARGIDDITYHLTSIIEFIKSGKIFVISTSYRPHFSMPLNAELLFMWPTIYYKNDYAFGLVQYFAGLVGILSVYSISRLFIVNKKTSFFVAQLFIFSPVIMAQSGSAYIDLILSVFFLTALYFSAKYYMNRKDVYLYMAAFSIGMMGGMKYTALILVLSLQVFILNHELIKDKLKLLRYCTIGIICGGYWYLRNLVEFGSFFPFIDSILRNEDSVKFDGNDFYYYISALFQKTNQLSLYDLGLGSLHGGYGVVFWGIALPSLLYCLIRSFKLPHKNKLFPVCVWLQIFPGLLFLLLSPLDRLYYRPRYSIFMIALGLIATGKLIQKFSKHGLYRFTIICSCCLFSFLSLVQLSNTVIPSYRIDFAIRNKLQSDVDYSKMKYLILDGTTMREIWETLDFISKDYSKGLNCYFAMSNKDFATPFYGSKLQNRIWNFSPDINNPPDTYIFHFEENKQVKYLGKKITIDQVLKNPEYKLIDMVDNSYLFLHRKFIENENQVSKSLMKHYENYYSEDIDIIKKVVAKLDKNIPVVTSSYLGFVFTYLKEMKITDNDVYTVPVRYENEVIDYYDIKKFYTLGFIPQGFNTKHIGTIRIGDEEIKIYENKLESI